MVPIRKPKMVERKVKLMSVQASPVVKKIVRVLAIALGCDQKNASIQPARAAISQSATVPTRMPICAATSAQVGQSLATGRRRTGRGVGLAAGELGCWAWRPRVSTESGPGPRSCRW